ncbi:Superoxide dismutase [Mn], mitochondrial [Gnomoniopsis smithogilvyi]|uniref:Superoxide dismutase n=1 Tax=Gnomoniopsis smithogilvyi TaxID=1191159 RepID=A0A9W8Z108_9PEZI|nr:Superoxide dismutase [Mn], mitochondrial [Gnomoniopsis smithogilvyi]
MAAETYSLPQLPYAYDALEPSISKQIMELHHSKHHQTYVTNLNKAVQALAEAVKSNDIDAQISLQPAINFHGGGHINHSLFWENLTPASSPDASPEAAEQLVVEIEQTWGSLAEFQEAFTAKLLAIQGSGWGWLVKVESKNQLQILTTKDQDPVPSAFVPVFGVDMWEHAYYLQYLNGKGAYVENIWKIINWKTAEKRFLGGRADAFQVLRASLT